MIRVSKEIKERLTNLLKMTGIGVFYRLVAC